MSKFIIWESGVSKSQFYRIIRGKEAPSPETKKRISQSLGIDSQEFDLLHERSKSQQQKNNLPKNKSLKLLVTLAICLILAALTAYSVNNTQKKIQIVENTIVEGAKDRTKFIKDVTIPDGTAIPVNTEFVKTWRVKNIGNVTWKNRYLMRTTPAFPLLCSSPSMVPIPETAPGETVDISVTFVTPHLPGTCRTDWKTADDRGNFYYPEMHGLFSIVVVTD